MTPRLEVLEPSGDPVLRVGRGEVHLLEDQPALLAVLVGHGPSGWQVRVDGRPVRSQRTAARVRRGLAVVGPAPVAADVSVHDHLAAVVGSGRASALLGDSPLLAGRGADPAGVLSGGERRALAWLRAVAVAPVVVVLDRAGEGLDAATLDWAGEQVAAWCREDVAVVVHPGRSEERGWARPGPAGP